MGRGLSDLQKTVLSLTFENRQAGIGAYPTTDDEREICEEMGFSCEEMSGHDLTTAELVHRHFGWMPGYESPYYGRKKIEDPIEFIRGRRFNQKFIRSDIGDEEYNRVHATVSRTLKRLESRGLIKNGGWKLRLTDAGLTQAQQLNGRNG